jgi:hypothetical protein
VKLLLIAEKDTTRDALVGRLKPRGFEFIHYRLPIKAMDNIDEIEPDVVLFSAEDFPRHWKPFIRFLRETRNREQTAFVLLTGESFSFDEAAKANHLEVSGIISEIPKDMDELRKLEDIVTRYSALSEERNDLRYIPSDNEHIEFIFTHPQNYRIVTGILFDLSPTGASFVPDDPKSTNDISAGTKIAHCSLKFDNEVHKISCRVVRNSGRIALRLLNGGDELEQAIIRFIDSRAERELETLLHDKT